MSSLTKNFRIYHRYLGFFLAGIMLVYAFSGVVMIFRTTDAFKIEKQVSRELAPDLTADELGKELRIRNFTVIEESDQLLTFEQGTYEKATGKAELTLKELPGVIKKFEDLHKATTRSPLYFLNIFFGVSLMFFAVSSLFMFARKTKHFKTGMVVVATGVVFAILMLLLT